MSGFSDFFLGTPEVRENVSTLLPEQQDILTQATNAAKGRGAGGAFGTSADYYRDLMSDDNADYRAFAAPQLRQYNEDIVPGLSEQFAGMGSGGLSSSGFRNAQIQGATDLSERLGAIRANLRQSGAQGLQNIGQAGLGNYSQNMVTEPGTQGFFSAAAPIAGAAAGMWLGGPAGAAVGYAAGKGVGGLGSEKAPSPQNSGQYNSQPNYKGQASAQVANRQPLPGYGGGGY